MTSGSVGYMMALTRHQPMSPDGQALSLTDETQPGHALSLTDIPTEDILFKHVLPILDVRDLFHLRATCRQLHDCVLQYFTVMTKLDLIYTGPKFNRSALNLITTQSFLLKHLNLSQAHKWLKNEDVVGIVSDNSMIESVDLGSCLSLTSALLPRLADLCPHLREINLARCHWVQNSDLLRLVRSCPDLDVMDLSGCWEVQDESIINIAKLCPRLRDLNLSEIYSITDQSVMALAQYCSNLTTLKIHSCWRVTDDSIRVLGEYCKKLTRLHVKDCRSVTEVSIARLRVRGVLVDLPRPSYQLGADYTDWLQKLNVKLQI